MYARILVPIDGSPTSDRGLAEAVKLARLTGARLRLIHVIDVVAYSTAMDGFSMTAELLPIVREAGARILKTGQARVDAGGVPVETALIESRAGRVCDQVVADATTWEAELIVIGTHGRRGVGRMFMGSDAEQIVRLAASPVLLVRSPESAAPRER